jgi:hypothetical protein
MNKSLPASDLSSKHQAQLVSAFRPPIMAPPPTLPTRQWTQTPPMRDYHYIRVITNVGEDSSVTFQQTKKAEIIEIATDWPEGEKAAGNKKQFDTTGYIGRGFSKHAIYVW